MITIDQALDCVVADTRVPDAQKHIDDMVLTYAGLANEIQDNPKFQGLLLTLHEHARNMITQNNATGMVDLLDTLFSAFMHGLVVGSELGKSGLGESWGDSKLLVMPKRQGDIDIN